MSLILTKKSGVYRVINDAKGVQELARISMPFSENQLTTLNKRIDKMSDLNDDAMILKFNELVDEIHTDAIRSITFEQTVVRTPEELFRYTGVRKIDVNIETGVINAEIKIGDYIFPNVEDLLEFLKSRSPFEIAVTEVELEKYTQELALKSGTKPERKLQDRICLPESDLDSFLSQLPQIKNIKSENGEYYVEYRHNYEFDGPFTTLSDLYEYLLKKINIGGTEKLKQSFLKWCER